MKVPKNCTVYIDWDFCKGPFKPGLSYGETQSLKNFMVTAILDERAPLSK